ncbi:uncharacterized protein LOC128237084 [Mya arenaria]|uniref:uncharacterized protein LOC128237084 n=1 Tax=Mya arenaria TaxID=6604 RepID=UPI0022E288C3|nr:uncharacterized protein LOC128237084 [Mya arenaria]
MADCERSMSKLSLVSQMSQMVADTPKKDLTEVKSFAKPPQAIKDVLSACLLLLGDCEKISGDTWIQARKAMGASEWLKRIQGLDPDEVPDKKKKMALEILSKYDLDSVKAKSLAIASLYNWAKAVAEC